MDFPLAFYFILPVVALLYSSVGHGGASGYLALMALFNAQPLIMKPTALILNLFVAGTSFFWYWKKGHFNWKLFWPFAIVSIPAAFIGGYWQLDPLVYRKVLGLLLLFSMPRLLGLTGKGSSQLIQPNLFLSLLIGFLIGLLSGLIGIGGGIILSPIILLLHWADMKETAAVSALFIWINSLSGLLGMWYSSILPDPNIFWLVILATTGGMAGAYLGSDRLNPEFIKKLLGFVLILASVKLLFI